MPNGIGEIGLAFSCLYKTCTFFGFAKEERKRISVGECEYAVEEKKKENGVCLSHRPTHRHSILAFFFLFTRRRDHNGSASREDKGRHTLGLFFFSSPLFTTFAAFRSA